MTSEIELLKAIPSGWYKKVNKYTSEIEDTRKVFQAGDLSSLFTITYQKNLRFNYLNLKAEVNGEPLADDVIENLYVALSERGYSVPKNTAIDALHFAAQKNGFHPVVEYLEQVASDPKIQPIDLNTVSTKYLGTNSDLYDSMLKATLIGLVSRVFDRGCKFDTCCVLKGSQGIGKSSFWRILASEDWFCDTWQEKDQDLFMAIQTCVIYELAELDSMTSKKDAGRVKALLSSATDTFKRPYARGIGKHPRPSILVGSCNASDFLNDPTGSRRFWIIDLKDKVIDLNKLIRDRERILKAAVLAFRQGIEPRLTDQEQNESNEKNHLYETENPFYSCIYEWANSACFDIDWGSQGRNGKGFTTSQAIVASGCRDEKSIKNPDLKMAASVLKDLGFEQTYQGYKDGKKTPRKWLRINQ